MTVNFKSDVTSSNTNSAYVSKTADDEKTGKLSLNDGNGTPIDSSQKFTNQIADSNGETEDDAARKTYSSEQIIANGDDRKVAIGKLDLQVKTNQDDIASTNLLKYQGNWDAPTNTPTLSDGTGTLNHWYRVNVAGSQDLGSGSITYQAGDRASFNGTIWERWDSLSDVTTVHSRVGDVVSANGDYDCDQITETNTRKFAIKHNRDSAVNPTVTDDSSLFYSVGSKWNNSTLQKEFILQDASVAAAVWIAVGLDEVATIAEIDAKTDNVKPVTSFGLAGSQLQTDVDANNIKVTRHADTDSLPESATNFYAIFHERNAIIAPTVNDDSGDGFSIGSTWFDSVEGKKYVLQDATVAAAVWIETGGAGGAGGIDVFYVEQFEVNEAVDVTDTGNNAALVGGALAGALADDVATQIKAVRSLKYTQAAGSLNDFFFLKDTYTTEIKDKNNDAGLNFYFKYDGLADDMAVVVYDITNSTLLSSSLDLLTSETDATRYSTSYFVPDTCNEYKIGFHVKAENIGAILIVDEIEGSLNPFVYKNLIDEGTLLHSAVGSTVTGTNPLQFNSANFTDNNFSNFATYSAGVWTTVRPFEFIYSVSFTNSISNQRLTLEIDGVIVNNENGITAASGNGHVTVTGSYPVTAGQTIEFQSNGSPNSTPAVLLSLRAEVASEHVITPASANSESYYATDAIIYSSNNLALPYFNTVAENTISALGTVTNDSSDGFIFTATKKVRVNMSFWFAATTASWIAITKNGSATDLDTSAAALPEGVTVAITTSVSGQPNLVSYSGTLEIGDFLATNVSTGKVVSTNAATQGVTFTVEPYEVKMTAAVPTQKQVTDSVEYETGRTINGVKEYAQFFFWDGSSGGTGSVNIVLGNISGVIRVVSIDTTYSDTANTYTTTNKYEAGTYTRSTLFNKSTGDLTYNHNYIAAVYTTTEISSTITYLKTAL